MRNRSKAAVEIQIKHATGMMINIMQRLETLAPHPDRPQYKGPVFASINSDIKPAADYDGMLGSIGMEQMVGAAFASAASDSGSSAMSSAAQAIGSTDLLDAASEYLSDKSPHNNYGRGKGSFALGEHKTICNIFNTLDERSLSMAAFKRDETQRHVLEKELVSYDRMLSSLQYQRSTPEFALAA